MIRARPCSLPLHHWTALLLVAASPMFNPTLAADSGITNHADDVVLPPPPAYGTPASQMRLPNLKPLGDDSGSSFAPAAPSPAATTSSGSAPAPANRTQATAPQIRNLSPAEVSLQKLKQRTGLSDAQLAELKAAQLRLSSGDEAGALRAAAALSTKLDNDSHIYPVGDGQNLFSIAGQEGMYANSNLWPLLWWNNQPELPNPAQLRVNQRLRVLAHPTLDQVNLALNYARTHNVLTAPVEDRNLLTRALQK